MLAPVTANHGGFTVADIEARLQTTDRGIRKLIAAGHLKTLRHAGNS